MAQFVLGFLRRNIGHISEMDVEEAMLMLSFTRQAMRTKPETKQFLQKKQTAVTTEKARARETSQEPYKG